MFQNVYFLSLKCLCMFTVCGRITGNKLGRDKAEELGTQVLGLWDQKTWVLIVGLMAHYTCLGVGSSLRMKRWNRCEGFSGVCWLLRSVPGPTLRELVLLEASRVAITTGALRPLSVQRVRQVAVILQIPGKAPMQEKQSSCQPARVSPGSTMQAEGGSCLGKIWGSEAVSSFGLATRSIYQKQTKP